MQVTTKNQIRLDRTAGLFHCQIRCCLLNYFARISAFQVIPLTIDSFQPEGRVRLENLLLLLWTKGKEALKMLTNDMKFVMCINDINFSVKYF